MPELPEVETIKRELERAVLNKKIIEVKINNFKVIKGRSMDASVLQKTPRPVDFVFLDGDHTYFGILQELEIYKYFTNNIAGHDWKLRPVMDAVNDFCDRYNLNKNFHHAGEEIWEINL